MITNKDQLAQTRLFAINLATENPARVTQVPQLHQAIDFGRAEAVQAEQELWDSAKAVSEDKQQNKSASQTVDAAINAAVEEYAVLQQQIRVNLIPVRLKDVEAMGPSELSKRNEFFEVNFSAAPSKLIATGRTKTVSYLTNAVQACAQSDYVSKQALAPLAAKVTNATQALAALKDEELDDVPLLNKLYQARANASRTYQAFRLLVQSALQFSQSPHSIDQFILYEVKRQAPEHSEEIEALLADDASAAALADAAPTKAVLTTSAPQ